MKACTTRGSHFRSAPAVGGAAEARGAALRERRRFRPPQGTRGGGAHPHDLQRRGRRRSGRPAARGRASGTGAEAPPSRGISTGDARRLFGPIGSIAVRGGGSRSAAVAPASAAGSAARPGGRGAPVMRLGSGAVWRAVAAREPAARNDNRLQASAPHRSRRCPRDACRRRCTSEPRDLRVIRNIAFSEGARSGPQGERDEEDAMGPRGGAPRDVVRDGAAPPLPVDAPTAASRRSRARCSGLSDKVGTLRQRLRGRQAARRAGLSAVACFVPVRRGAHPAAAS